MKRLPASLRKFLRKEKSRIRREFDSAEAERKIRELMARLSAERAKHKEIWYYKNNYQ